MSRLLRDQRGGIFVLSAIVIPVFIVLAALVVDVGQWYTHKRQLQNRADAAALAAGVAYAQNWKACVQTGDATLRATTAREIANVARQYAANPDANEYAPDPLPSSLYNENIANQDKLDVVINSTTYRDDSDPDTADPDSDYNDDNGDGTTPARLPADPKLGDPCFSHLPGTDHISPGGGQWTDVRVKEGELGSLFSGTIGLPIHLLDKLGVNINRNVARARVEIRPALSGRRFLPLAVPDNIISKVQVRYFDECRDPNHNSPLAIRDLAELPGPYSSAYSASGGGGLWGLPDPASNPPVGDPNLSFPLTVPSYGGCGQPYLPIGVEVRIASQPTVNLNQSCSTLRTSVRYADCFERLSQIRVFNDGDPDNQPRITHVRVIGGCGAPQDGYFSLLPVGTTGCDYDVAAEVNWGTRDDTPNNVPGNFTVQANGQDLSLVSWNVPNGTAIYASSGGALTASEGANDVTISLNWNDTNTSHSWQGAQCRNGGNNPCQYNGSEVAHRAFVATEDNAGAVGLVRTSMSGFVGGFPGPPLENVNTGGASGDPPSPISIYPTVGIRSTLRTGVFTVLRTEDARGSQLLNCDPALQPGQTFDAFRFGCNPWYGRNSFTDPTWWNSAGQECPPQSDWFRTGPPFPAPFVQNSSANPWRCVPVNQGSRNGQTGNWMSVATENCDDIQNNSCQTHGVVCNYDGNYDGKPGDPTGWIQDGGDSGYPRVVRLFIIPYQSLKGVTGNADEEAPVLGFASFYVMDWTSSGQKSDPCPDTTFGGVPVDEPADGSVTGVFVETVDYEPGPVDPNATCVEGQLIPCRVTLVR